MDEVPECTCRNGMRPVTEVWARQEAGIARDADLDALEREVVDIRRQMGEAGSHHGELDPDGQPRYPMPDTALVEQLAAYHAALSTVFPCPTCRPEQFSRWRHGCYRPNHEPRRCRRCKDAAK